MPSDRRKGDPVLLPDGCQNPRDGLSGPLKPQKVPPQRGLLERTEAFSAAAVFAGRPADERAGKDQLMERGRPVSLLGRSRGRSGFGGLFRESGFRPDLPPAPFPIGPHAGRLPALGAKQLARTLGGDEHHYGFAAAPAGDGNG